MFVYVIYSFPILQTCAQQVCEKIFSWNTLYWNRAVNRNSLQFFLQQKMWLVILSCYITEYYVPHLSRYTTEGIPHKELLSGFWRQRLYPHNCVEHWIHLLEGTSGWVFSDSAGIARGKLRNSQHHEETFHSTAPSQVFYPCSDNFRWARWGGNHLKIANSPSVSAARTLSLFRQLQLPLSWDFLLGAVWSQTPGALPSIQDLGHPPRHNTENNRSPNLPGVSSPAKHWSASCHHHKKAQFRVKQKIANHTLISNKCLWSSVLYDWQLSQYSLCFVTGLSLKHKGLSIRIRSTSQANKFQWSFQKSNNL